MAMERQFAIWIRAAKPAEHIDAEMHRVFNCGIGMTVIVSADNADADAAMAQLQAAGETVYRIGEIRAREEAQAQAVVQ